MKNQAMYLVDTGKFELRDVPMPVCGDHQVIIKMEYMGICGSDLFFFGDHNHEIADGLHKLPFIIGHECAGEVFEVGKKVAHLKAGDKVAVEPGVPCGQCSYCKSGRYNLCPDVKFMAAPPYFNGAMRRFVEFPAHMVFKLPEKVSTLEGALIEPLSIGLHATKRSGIGLGNTAVILGSGCIGLTVLLSCIARGASKVVVDVFDNRLEKAMELGASATVNSKKEDPIQAVRCLLGEDPEYVFEAAGRPETVELAAKLVGRGGKITIVGSVNAPSSLKFYELTEKEIEIIMTFRYANIYPAAIKAIESGKISVSSIASHVYDFEDSQHAFEEAEHNKQNVVKGVIRF